MKPKQGRDRSQTITAVEASKIKALAHAIFVEREREGRPGDHLSDWYEAERQLAAGKR